MQAIFDNTQSMLQTAFDRIFSKLEPLFEKTDEIERTRPPVEADDVHVDAAGAFERRR